MEHTSNEKNSKTISNSTEKMDPVGIVPFFFFFNMYLAAPGLGGMWDLQSSL